jgi:hypothetical protein
MMQASDAAGREPQSSLVLKETAPAPGTYLWTHFEEPAIGAVFEPTQILVAGWVLHRAAETA